jgi:glycosyltransferase involved in cell wall biosynthesis
LGERTDVNALLQEADAMCLSSIWEGMPIILLEALFASCIPICTPVGGIPNVITDGKDGILASGVTVADYVDALKRFLLLSDAELQLMKGNCKETSLAYDIAISSNKYIDLYR